MEPFPNKDTKTCISVSQNPGNSGAKFHNNLYKILGLNFLYIPIKLTKFIDLKKSLVDFNITGCSVSMPFKNYFVSMLDLKHSTVVKTGAVNTIINNKGKLKGYNTDFYAATEILKKIKLKNNDSVLLLGNGGVASAIYCSLKYFNLKKIYLCSRNQKKFSKWNLSLNSKKISWKNRNNIKVSLLINATSIGMDKKKIPINLKKIHNFKSILDLVIENNPKFKKTSISKNVKFYSGYEFSLLQAIKQFKLYTGINISFQKAINYLKIKNLMIKK